MSGNSSSSSFLLSEPAAWALGLTIGLVVGSILMLLIGLLIRQIMEVLYHDEGQDRRCYPEGEEEVEPNEKKEEEEVIIIVPNPMSAVGSLQAESITPRQLAIVSSSLPPPLRPTGETVLLLESNKSKVDLPEVAESPNDGTNQYHGSTTIPSHNQVVVVQDNSLSPRAQQHIALHSDACNNSSSSITPPPSHHPYADPIIPSFHEEVDDDNFVTVTNKNKMQGEKKKEV